MKKKIALLGVLMLLVGMCGLAGATTITYDYVLDINGVPTSSYAGAIVEDFEGSLLWDWSGNYQVFSASVSGQTAAPAGDPTKFVSVPNPLSSGTATVTGFGLANYFGLYWGSVDDYNSLAFYKGGDLVASFTGLDVIQSPGYPNGDQGSPLTNLYINFIDLPHFDTFKMTSTQFAFEADNIAIAPIPEPSTMLLLGGGLAGLAWISRKRKKA